MEAGQRVVGVEDFGRAGVGGDGAGVADLAARLGVEGRAIEHDRDFAVVAGNDRDDGGLRLELLAADEVRRAEPVEHRLEVGEVGVQPFLARLAATDLLRAPERRVVAVDVDVDAALCGDLLGHLEREAVRLVQVERDVAAEGRTVGEVGQLVVEQGRTALERATECRLFAGNRLRDVVAVRPEVGIRVLHELDAAVDQRCRHLAARIEQVARSARRGE